MVILILSFLQTILFTLLSRARNRDKVSNVIITSILSNGVFILTLGYITLHGVDLITGVLYVVGSTSGSVAGIKLAKSLKF